ncbi:MAG: RnfABCDGE type electron transport complex subunit B [Oscillospiraceae bacterium]|jgi:Na+-translocating ferredoxin:NAD+ oxidoreductase RNF subunit RnfB|nr:RnfABCDGE type electron transport complex subunit B [Oscillospiraceae bacterium]
MSAILIPVGAVSGIGLLCAVMLTVVSKVMAVQVDERITAVRDVLPGANCGACGYAGCDGYAAALIEDGVKTNLCVPGSDDVSLQISNLLGVEFEDVIERIAVCHCGGTTSATQRKMEYGGVISCAAAKLLYGGEMSCRYGCIGYGDCARVCPNGAVCIEDGVARINPRRCTGCGLCAKVCPNGIISTLPDTVTTVIKCSSIDRGGDVRKKCQRGCIGCMRCVRECPNEAIAVVNNLAVIDYDKCGGCGHCAEVCTVKCVKIANFTGVFNKTE